MSIIKLSEPWAFHADESITLGELEELQSHFVDDSNHGSNWCIDEWNGISTNGISDWHTKLKYFHDKKYNESKVTVYTIEQLRTIIAEHLAEQFIEPKNVTKFVVGKWYKWFQKDHGKTQKGKCATLYDSHFEMKPWICHSSEYFESGMFNLRDVESIEIIEDLSEIQDLLPDGHQDKWVKTAPKSERYLETMKFFEQLKEPERSEAIANYDEDYGSGTKVPKDLAEAINYGFEWSSTKQEHEYWMVIKDEIMSGIYFQEELLVFGKYKIGDIVVLQVCTDRYPMFKVSKDSTPDKMIDETGAHSTNPGSFRPATPEEVEAYNQGIRNVADIKPKDCKVIPEYVECVRSHQSPYYTVGKIYTWPNTISDSGKSNKVEVLKGSVWEFKPSTKEAYDKQQEKFKMKELLSEPKPTEIKPAKGMHVRCLKENSWHDGKTKVGQILEIQDVSSCGNMWVNNQSLAKERLGRGEFELLPDYKEKPWVAQVGDWVYTLPDSSGWGMSVKDEGKIFKVKEITNNWCEETRIVLDGSSNPTKSSSTIDPITLPNLVRKATQEEIDSVTKLTKTTETMFKVGDKVIVHKWYYTNISEYLPCKGVIVCKDANPYSLTPYQIKLEKQVYNNEDTWWFEEGEFTLNVSTEPEWTADNWYVEVSSQEEANAVIDAASKMYGESYNKGFSLNNEWKYVSFYCKGKYYSIISRKFINVGAKPRPITDFIHPEITRVSDEIDCTNSIPLRPEECYKSQQDELVIYKPKQTRLVEPGAVSASVSTTNLIIKSNSKYL